MKLNHPEEYFNLWSIKALLYGADQKYRKDNEGKASAPFIFSQEPIDGNGKKGNWYKGATAEGFIKTHFNITVQKQMYLEGQYEDIDSSYIYSGVMKIQKPSGNYVKVGQFFLDKFIEEWSRKTEIVELEETNENLIRYWNPAQFRPLVRRYIRLILGEEVTDKEGDKEFVKALDGRKNYITDSNPAISENVRELLMIISHMVDNEPDTSDKNGKILSWLLLAALLHDEIRNMRFYLELKNNNLEYIRIIDNENTKNNKACTDGIYVSTKQLIEQYGWDEMKIAQNVVLNDRLLYGVTEEALTEGSPAHWSAHIESRPETFGYIYSPEQKKNIIGNFSFCGLRIPNDPIQKKELFDKIEKGLLYESQLKAEDVSSLAVPGTHCILYILNLSMNKGEDEFDNLYHTLVDNLLKTFLEYAQKKIFFDRVYTRLFLKKHYAIYEELGFEQVSGTEYNEYNSRMYKMENFPYSLNWKQEFINPLVELYNEERNRNRAIVLRPCVKSDLYQSEIYDLIYKTDPYIYPSMFGSLEVCRQVLSLVYEKNTDLMFNYANLFVALSGGQIIGLILWNKGGMKWDNRIITASFTINGIEIPEYYKDVCDVYFPQYDTAQDGEHVEIVNCCVSEGYRNKGIGKMLLRAFLDWRKEKYISLYCLADNHVGIKLYEGQGFKNTKRVNAYTPTKDKSTYAYLFELNR